ncbi:hypothetical protein [Actinomyces bouchesdurhonensis]|uniref:hypothetical protein n=1 Tax=Actinomyces bouchesdurhonensis TaxID=1852361 RepID=UPI0023F13674|nr:hypothetical protein [Actinomyces bouchesdurhonensis]
MEINITLDVQGATVEEVQWLAGLLAAQRTAPAPITVEAETAAPVEAEDKPKKTAKKPAAKKATPKKADPAPEPEPTPEPEPVADETDGATLDDADAPNEDALKAQAIELATALLATEGGAEAVKAALETVGARRVSALTGDDIRAFIDALPEA